MIGKDLMNQQLSQKEMKRTHSSRSRLLGLFVAGVLASGLLVSCESRPQQSVAAVDTIVVVHPGIVVTPEVELPAGPFSLGRWSVLADLERYEANCTDQGLLDMKEPLRVFSDSIHQQKIMYKSIELSDCSGMFHRTLQWMSQKCAGYEIPDVQVRSSDGLARWYAGKGELIMIEDTEQMAELIKPGAVMFYGTDGERYQLPQDSARVVDGGIEHMGVVVDVERNDKGEIINYHLFHGRRTGLPAAITGSPIEGRYNHVKKEKPNHPMFGNGNQQWVAVARIFNPAMVKEES